MSRFEVLPDRYERVTLGALLSLCFIVVTGAAVRLTDSGLGCSEWPTCEDDRVVAPLEYHAMVEFVNRTITGVVSLAVVAAVLGSLRRRPRRPDLTRWSLGLVAGVAAQAILGGLLVKAHLAKPFLMGHFLLSMVLVWNAVVLWRRAARPDDVPVRLTATAKVASLSRAAVAACVVVLVSGTVVTAAGPHGGDPDVRPLDLPIPAVARVHGLSMIVFGTIVVALVLACRRGEAAPATARRAEQLLVVLAVQAAVGYTQYFTGVPVVLVGVHVAGATLVWAAIVAFHLDLWRAEPTTGADVADRSSAMDPVASTLAQSTR